VDLSKNMDFNTVISCHLITVLKTIFFDRSTYSSPNIMRVIKSRRMRWAGHVARMVEERGMYRVLVGKPKGRKPLGRPRRRWVKNIRMDFIFGRVSNLYLCLYNQLFALYHYVFKFLIN